MHALTDVNSDQQQNGLEIDVKIDRDTASRLQLTPAAIDNTLYDAFGQRDVSTIYNPLNQYHVVMEVAPQYWQSPQTLDNLWVSTAGGAVSGSESTNAVPGTVTSAQASANRSAANLASDVALNQATNSIAQSGRGTVSTGAAVSTAAEAMVPLATFAGYGPGNTPLAVNHQGSFVAATLSFNLAPGASLSQATAQINQAIRGSACPERFTAASRERRGPIRITRQRAGADPVGTRRRVYRARGALRELHPPPHDPLDAAFGRHRRGACAVAVQQRIQHHRLHRRHPPDRDRQEERHHDDRLRARRSSAMQDSRRAMPSTWLPAALSADHDDDDGGDAGRVTARLRHRRRCRRSASRSGSRSSAD